MTETLRCDMSRDCKRTVTHIDEKGWVYCREHGLARKYSRRCRQLKHPERVKLQAGQTIKY